MLVGFLVGWLMTMVLKSSAARPVFAEAAYAEQINLAQWLAAGKLKSFNRNVEKLQSDAVHLDDGVHINEKPGPGIVWVDGTDFFEGILEVDVRGRYVLHRSFVGIAFHGGISGTYEAVYVRPFNFRASDPVRHKHGVQYIAPPEHDWQPLREKFPDEFENSVDQTIVPTDWVHLRVVVKGTTIQAYVGPATSP